MKLLVATTKGQGVRKNDFMLAEEGELVFPGHRCDGGFADDECGCSRSMAGRRTLKGTTTVLVVEDDEMYPAQLTGMAEEFLKASWGETLRVNFSKRALALTKWLQRELEYFRDGDVLEFRDGRFFKREV